MGLVKLLMEQLTALEAWQMRPESIADWSRLRSR